MTNFAKCGYFAMSQIDISSLSNSFKGHYLLLKEEIVRRQSIFQSHLLVSSNLVDFLISLNTVLSTFRDFSNIKPEDWSLKITRSLSSRNGI